MPKPASGFQYDRFLTGFMVGYRNPQASFGHLSVPTVLHDDESGLYPILSKADWLRHEAQLRARSTPAAMSGFAISQGTFKTLPYAFKQPVDIDDAAKAKDPIDLENLAAQYVADKMFLANESDFTTAAFTASQWSGFTDQTGVASAPSTNQFIQWDQAASTPGKNIAVLAGLMQESTGFYPNTIFVGGKVNVALQYNADVRATVQYTNEGSLQVFSPNAMAKYFNMQKYVVCSATRNTAREGASASMSMFNGKSVLLAYIDPSILPDPMGTNIADANTVMMEALKFKPSALIAVRYDLPGGVRGVRARSYFQDDIKSSVVEADQSFVYTRTAADLGGLLTSVVA